MGSPLGMGGMGGIEGARKQTLVLNLQSPKGQVMFNYAELLNL